MGNQNTIQLTLTVKDDGSVVVQQFGKNTEEALGKTGKGVAGATGALDTLKSSWLGITAVAAGAGLAISKAMDYMVLGAKADQAEASFRTLAGASGESADQIIANMKRASASTIDDSQLMQKAAKAMLLEFSGDQITKMTEMARLGARTTGEDVGQAFDKIVDAISTQMPRALKQYGLITKEQMAIVTQATAEGVTGIDLLSIATSNFAKQQGKMGPLLENDAEKMQQYRAAIEETKESFGKLLTIASAWVIKDLSNATAPIMATAASIATGSTAPIQAWTEDVIGLKAAQAELAKYQAAYDQAVKMKQSTGASTNEELKASLGVVARKKVEFETLKALDTAYFKSQEDNIKGIAELMKTVGGDEYQITKDSLQKMETLNAEYYTRTSKEIELEAAARTKAEKDKVSDLMFTAEKMKTLDAESTTRATTLAQQRTMLSIQTAQNDIKNLTSRLGDYQKYYDSLKAKMDKNTEDEKKHLDAIKALRQQSIDLDNSAAAQLALINGTNKNQTAQQTYDTGRSALNQKFMDTTNNLSGQNGQEQIKALQDYMQQVTALQQQFANGVQGAKDIFGKPSDIISAAKVAEDASSDINRALALQQSAVAQLTEEKSKQAQADQQWGQVLQDEAVKAKTAIADIGATITDLSAKMEAMQKTIEIRGIDNATPVINDIASRLEQLHDKTVTITMKYVGGGGGGMSSGSDGFSDIPFALGSGEAAPVMDSFAVGTPYVPRTGIYQLHRGEAVIPAAQNNNNSRSITIGDLHIHIPANAAPQRPEDWRSITRDFIVPELRKMNA